MRPLYFVLGTTLAIACAQPAPEPSSDPGELVFVTNEDSGDLTVIATSTHEVIATIPVGKRPRGVRLSKDGRTAYVALSGSPKCPPWMSDEDCAAQVTDKTLDGIAVVDVAAGRVTKVLPGGSDPEQFDLSLDGKQICVANEDAADFRAQRPGHGPHADLRVRFARRVHASPRRPPGFDAVPEGGPGHD